ncbi:gamma-glutamyl-gamma-aminobutyrate hydrolase family protein [Gulosibacter faecalis]|jgi:putative glutamine amidotransferase|uniref:Gamma-glutamyl-gamma-aminobutyrate hydrolase family protein n=1 Tax=Gulosibacter faecalis TaxID=272240 RepID=A0ABW5UWQ6_9MICO|nr:gamma-glutamyl-gamma-aminobutyrate hydrolase family protein [Gulosibacter faecalis]
MTAVEIAVVVQVSTPDETEAARTLNRELIRVAVEELEAQGARARIYDVAADEPPNPDDIAAADGILVLGGGDVDATIYGHTDPVPNEYGKDRRADDRELDIIRRGIDDDAIMLHLCRGSQLLNVACGGTLVPDLQPFDLHKGPPGGPLFLDEEVELVEGSRVHALYGVDRLVVRNGHHQAVDRVGEGLRVAARAHDGIVEATERVENTWIIGVQWHPEEADADARDRRILFGEFLDQARRRP